MSKPPTHFNDKAKELWKGYIKELSDRELLQNSDLSALERLCILEAQADELSKSIAEKGCIAPDEKAKDRRSPELLALVNISTLVSDLKKSLAIGAYYRHRIGAKKEEKETQKKTALTTLMRKVN